jgi:predicted methyltransferase
MGAGGPPGVPTVQIYLDLNLKNSTRQPVTDDKTVADILKSLKTIYGGQALNT